MSKLTKITINGREYDSVEQMPPDVREQYEQAVAALEKEDLFKKLGLGKKGVTQTTQTVVQETITYNGRDYANRDELPAEARALLEKLPKPSPDDPTSEVKIETIETIKDIRSEPFIIKTFENREKAPERDPKIAWMLVSTLAIVVLLLLFLLYLAGARRH